MLFKKAPALAGHGDAVAAGEGCRHHADPDDDGRGNRGLSGIDDANDVDASPLHFHRVQEGKDLGTQVLPHLRDRVLAHRPKLLGLPVGFWAGGRLPGGCARPSDQEGGGGKAGVVEFGLQRGRG